MMKKSALLLYVCICGGSSLFATDYNAKAQIKFLGDARLHTFEGSCHSEPTVLKENQGTINVTFTVAVKNMNTEKEARDKEMFHMMENEKYPMIVGSLKDAQLVNGQNIQFPLSIHGVEAMVEAEVKDLSVETNKVHFHLDFPVSLEKFQLKAPSFLLGTIKVKDMVKVHVDVDAVP